MSQCTSTWRKFSASFFIAFAKLAAEVLMQTKLNVQRHSVRIFLQTFASNTSDLKKTLLNSVVTAPAGINKAIVKAMVVTGDTAANNPRVALEQSRPLRQVLPEREVRPNTAPRIASTTVAKTHMLPMADIKTTSPNTTNITNSSRRSSLPLREPLPRDPRPTSHRHHLLPAALPPRTGATTP